MSIERLIRQDDTWIAIDPVVGCAKDCQYCFLQIYGATPKKGEVIASPDDAIDSLLSYETYRPESPIMLASETDAFMNIPNIDYYSEFLRRYDARGIGNTLAFVTKCHVPDKFIDLASNLVNTRVIFYLSYSGLGKPIEPTTNIPKLRDNFPRLSRAGLDVIHYWRPFLPQNSNPDKIAEVVDHAAIYAKCTVAAGLKVNAGILQNISRFWPELAAQQIEYDKVATVWPIGVRDYVDQYTRTQHPDYPLFWVNSCALAYVLEGPEFNGMYGSHVCEGNHCPLDQRCICGDQFAEYRPTESDIQTAFDKMEITGGYNMDEQKRTIRINGEVSHGQLIYLRQKLKYNVLAGDEFVSENEWGGPAVGRDDLHLPYTQT